MTTDTTSEQIAPLTDSAVIFQPIAVTEKHIVQIKIGHSIDGSEIKKLKREVEKAVGPNTPVIITPSDVEICTHYVGS